MDGEEGWGLRIKHVLEGGGGGGDTEHRDSGRLIYPNSLLLIPIKTVDPELDKVEGNPAITMVPDGPTQVPQSGKRALSADGSDGVVFLGRGGRGSRLDGGYTKKGLTKGYGVAEQKATQDHVTCFRGRWGGDDIPQLGMGVAMTGKDGPKCPELQKKEAKNRAIK